MALRTSDIVVIGAGVVGATIAYELADGGARVTVVDSGAGPGGGCSYANAGLLSPSHVEPMTTPANIAMGVRSLFTPDAAFRLTPRPALAPWLARFVLASRPARAALMTTRLRSMAWRSLDLHLAYPQRGVPTGVRRTGAVDVYQSAERWQVAKGKYPAAQAMDDAALAVCAGLALPAAGAISQPLDATVFSLDYITAMIDAARAAEARVRWGARVVSLSLHENRVVAVTLADGTVLRPDTVVVAAGLGSAALCASVGVRVPLQGALGYVIDVEPPPQMPRLPLTLKEAKVVITPYPDRLRACGTLDLGAAPGRIKPNRLAAVRAAAATALPGVDWGRQLQAWVGARPSTSDGVPVIGRSSAVGNLIVAAGHGMWGVILSPITAEWVRRGLDDDPSALTDASFSPDRFSGLI